MITLPALPGAGLGVQGMWTRHGLCPLPSGSPQCPLWDIFPSLHTPAPPLARRILVPPPTPTVTLEGQCARSSMGSLTAPSYLPLTFSDGGVPTAPCEPLSHTGSSHGPLGPGKWPPHPSGAAVSLILLSSQPLPNSIWSANPGGSAFKDI